MTPTPGRLHRPGTPERAIVTVVVDALQAQDLTPEALAARRRAVIASLSTRIV